MHVALAYRLAPTTFLTSQLLFHPGAAYFRRQPVDTTLRSTFHFAFPSLHPGRADLKRTELNLHNASHAAALTPDIPTLSPTYESEVPKNHFKHFQASSS
jgi:hypothetical protein